MSWINEVRAGIAGLDLSRKNLRKFGLVVGAVFLIIGCGMCWKQGPLPAAGIIAGLGAVLMLMGAVAPAGLKSVYRFWMGFALAMGWIVSRVLLSLLYYLVITPIGLGLKLFGKSLMPLKIQEDETSYWIPIPSKRIDYRRMF